MRDKRAIRLCTKPLPRRPQVDPNPGDVRFQWSRLQTPMFVVVPRAHYTRAPAFEDGLEDMEESQLKVNL